MNQFDFGTINRTGN